MANRIWRNENYILLQNSDGTLASGHAKDIFIRPLDPALDSNTRFNFTGLTNLVNNNIVITLLRDIDGNPFASSQAFVDWYSLNTGNFNSAPGGSGVSFVSGEATFISDGVSNVLTIEHDAGFVPSNVILTATTPISINHLARSVDFDDPNVMTITFQQPPVVSDNITYRWTLIP